MRKIILVTLVATLLVVCSCNNTENKSEVHDQAKPSSGFDPNFSIALKENNATKIGLQVGLPTGWVLEESSVVNGNQTYVVKQGERVMIYMDSEAAGKAVPLSSDLGFFEDEYEFLAKEDAVESNGFKRSGVVIKSKEVKDQIKKIDFEYYVGYTNGKFGYVRLLPGDAYNFSAIDTCFAIVRSMKQM